MPWTFSLLWKWNTIGKQKKSTRNQIGYQILRGSTNYAYIHGAAEILLTFEEKLRVTMFGGYLVFYTKKNKALNINIKTDYWAHPKNRLHNPISSHLKIVSTTSVAHLVFHFPSPISATQSLCLQARRPIEVVHNLNFSTVTSFVNILVGFWLSQIFSSFNCSSLRRCIKWYFTWICLVLEWKAGFLARKIPLDRKSVV